MEATLRDVDKDEEEDCALCGEEAAYAIDRDENDISLYLCHGCVDVGLKAIKAFGFTVSIPTGGSKTPASGWWS